MHDGTDGNRSIPQETGVIVTNNHFGLGREVVAEGKERMTPLDRHSQSLYFPSCFPLRKMPGDYVHKSF